MDKRIQELEKLRDQAEKNLDRKLFNFYKKALKKLKLQIKKYVDEFEGLTFSEARKSKRVLRMASEIDLILKALDKDNQVNIGEFVKDRAIDGYLGTLYDVEGKGKINLSFNMLNERYINNLVGKKVAGKNFSERLYKHRDRLASATKKELLDGAISGEGYKKIAKKISEQTESTYKQALNIARTEGARVQTDTTQQAYQEAESLGVSMQKMWESSLDDVTRELHQDLDGQTVDIDEMFEIEGMEADGPGDFGDPEMDCNCRCTTVSVVEGISPTLRRDNETKEIIEHKSYHEWKKYKEE